MTMRRSNFADLLAPGFRQIFFLKFGEKPAQFTELFNVRKSNRQYEDDSYVTPFGNVPKKPEGQDVTFDDPIQGYDKRYTHDTFALAFRVTEEMQEDDLYGIVNRMPAALGRSMRNTREVSGANVYNNGFDGTNYADGGDGKELFATDHPLTGGGTQRNELSVAADLDSTSLEQALIDLRATTDDRGILLNLMPKKLVVAPSNMWNAKKLLGSAKVPEDANNAINPATGLGLQLVVNDYLTDPDAWFIIADEHEVNWFDRVMPDFMRDNEFNTGDAKFRTRARWSNGWSLPWGVFGSPGA